MTHVRLFGFTAVLVVGGLSAGTMMIVADDEDACGVEVSLGEALFVHNWARPDEWTRPEALGKGGDGLGPVFNDVSCVACHSMGGVGGAGGNDRNVELLSVLLPTNIPPPHRMGLIRRANKTHPQIAPDNINVMLHRFGFGEGDNVDDYDLWRGIVLQTVEQSERRFRALRPGEPFHDIPWRLSQRNTPALWGAGTIERLRRAGGDRVRMQVALAQNGGMRGVSGRLPRTIDGRVGWLGWRGHVEHLPEFVMSACANELGLAVTKHPQPTSPRAKETDGKAKSSRALDLTNAQVAALTNFVASLPPPTQVFPTDPQQREDVLAGERVFERIGCADCHVPDLGLAREIFSDLLLHDMGASLSDPSTAFPDQTPPTRTRMRSNYSGGSAPSPGSSRVTRTSLAQEWRTPPLWGVADSPPYLHDGRANTLDEAIRSHDGEGMFAAQGYRQLGEAEQSQVLAFLGTLRATPVALAAAKGTP